MLWLLAMTIPAEADEVRAALGGQLETQGHGIADLGWRRSLLSVQWYTDTLDLRLTDEREDGAWSVGLRGATFAAGLWITPWTDGAPDLQRAQRASYFGPDARVQRYLAGGLWVGASAFLRPHFFTPLSGATLQVPDTLWSRSQMQAGVWRDEGRIAARVAAGVDWTDTTSPAPHVELEGRLQGGTALAPFAELRASLAEGQTDVTATRIGGLTPYHVPVGGLAWAEVWAEDYAVARVGAQLSTGGVTTRLAADLGGWTVPAAATGRPAAPWAVGLEGRVRWQPEPWFVEGAVGWSPTWPRPDGVWPVPIYLLAGAAWTPL